MASEVARVALAIAVGALASVAPLDRGGQLSVAHAQQEQAAAPAVTATAAQDAQLAHARQIVADADRLFDAGHYAAALTKYTSAYEALEGHPRQYWVLHNLAVCNEHLFNYDIALSLYDEYLRRAPPTEEDRKQVSAVMRTLRSLLGAVMVESSVVGEVWLDDRLLGNAPGHWLAPAGRHVVELRAPRHEPERQEIQVSAGTVRSVRFAPQRLSTNAGPSPGYFWTAAGLSVAAGIAGATFGVMAVSAREEGLSRAELHLDTQADAERTRTLALASDVGFGAAVLFGATATVLFFVTDWSAPGTSERRQATLSLGSNGKPGATLRAEF